LNTLNDATPKIKCQGRNGVDYNLIFGLQSKLFLDPSSSTEQDKSHHDEVETATLYSGGTLEKHSHDHSEEGCSDCKNHSSHNHSRTTQGLEREVLTQALQSLSKENTWRVKGFIRLIDNNSTKPSVNILNWAFGRYELSAVKAEKAGAYLEEEEIIRLTLMGERGEVKRVARRFAGSIGANVL
jgi:G3E family GTPase